MLKRQKIISLKHPKSKAIRLNLRKLLVKIFYDQKAALKALWLGAKDDEQLSLLRELEDFKRKFQDSIVVCKICSQTEGDRIFFPHRNCWYCTDCFKRDVVPSSKNLRKYVFDVYISFRRVTF